MGECVFNTAKRVAGLQKFGERILTSRKFAELWRVRFDSRKACRKLAKFWRAPFDHRKTCRRLAVIRRVGFDHRKACRRLAEV